MKGLQGDAIPSRFLSGVGVGWNQAGLPTQVVAPGGQSHRPHGGYGPPSIPEMPQGLSPPPGGRERSPVVLGPAAGWESR